MTCHYADYILQAFITFYLYVITLPILFFMKLF